MADMVIEYRGEGTNSVPCRKLCGRHLLRSSNPLKKIGLSAGYLLTVPSGSPSTFLHQREWKGWKGVLDNGLSWIAVWAPLSSEFVLCLAKIEHFEGRRRKRHGYS